MRLRNWKTSTKRTRREGKETTDASGGWRLGRRVATSEGEIAYDIFGEGPPVVLIHGTPSRSFLWRRTVRALEERFSVYVYDLLGFGESERRESQDLSVAAQARLLKELLGAWGLEAPMVAGHDVGGALALRAHLLEGVRFRRLALIDAVALGGWETPSMKHLRRRAGFYRALPVCIWDALISAYLKTVLRTAASRALDPEALRAYVSQWLGPEGRLAYLRKDSHLDERDTAELEPLLGLVEMPVLVVWGSRDRWLEPAQADRLQRAIPGSSLKKIPGAGHLLMEDAPGAVARELADFFAARGRDF